MFGTITAYLIVCFHVAKNLSSKIKIIYFMLYINDLTHACFSLHHFVVANRRFAEGQCGIRPEIGKKSVARHDRRTSMILCRNDEGVS